MAQEAANPRRDPMGLIGPMGPMGHPISPISPIGPIRSNAERQTSNANGLPTGNLCLS
jgi:hypothetical protein